MDKNVLDNVKVVDDLLVSFYQYGTTIRSIQRVVEITKAGNVKTNKGQIFYPNGGLRGDQGYSRTTARIATNEDKESIKQMNFRVQALQYLHNLKNISYSDAVKVMGILNQERVGK